MAGNDIKDIGRRGEMKHGSIYGRNRGMERRWQGMVEEILGDEKDRDIWMTKLDELKKERGMERNGEDCKRGKENGQ